MDPTVERFIEEIAENEREYLTKGQEAGAEWAETASYKDLTYAAWYFKPQDESGEYDVRLVFFDEVLGSTFRGAFYDEPHLYWSEEGKDINELGEYWLEGWLESVRKYCSEVAAKVQEHQRNVRSGLVKLDD